MFTKAERLISLRNLKPKKKEGFLKIISIFSFLGIMLGVAILIIVMSVMNGFKKDLTNKILGLNPHIVIQPNGFEIDDDFISKLKEDFKELIKNMGYKIIEKENDTLFKYQPKKEKKTFSKKAQKESPFGVLKKLSFVFYYREVKKKKCILLVLDKIRHIPVCPSF